MTRKVIQRFGINDQGADPNWIVSPIRHISKGEDVPEGWELISNTELRIQLNNQATAYSEWLETQPLTPKNLNIKQERLANRIVNNPNESYRIYKYLSSDAITSQIDVTQPPHSIVYDKQLSCKVHESYKIDKGLKISVVVYIVNQDGTLGEEVLKGTISDYVFDENSGPMPSAQSMASRITRRQWILQDGNYREDELDVKVSPKIYIGQFEKNKEGQTRRDSIYTEVQKVYGTLITILKTQGDQVAAENIGKILLKEIGSEVINYIKTGSNSILDDLKNLADSTVDADEYGLNVQVVDIPPIKQSFPETIGMKIYEALQAKFEGNI